MIPLPGSRTRRTVAAIASAVGLASVATAVWIGAGGTANAAGSVPTPDHVVS